MWLSDEAKATLLAARQRQDGKAPEGVPRHGYLLCHGQPVELRATTLALLRRTRAQARHGHDPAGHGDQRSLERAALVQRVALHRN
jgi:hypothetical protein